MAAGLHLVPPDSRLGSAELLQELSLERLRAVLAAPEEAGQRAGQRGGSGRGR